MKKLSVLSLVLILICGSFCFVGCKNEEPTAYTISIQQAEYGVATVSASTAEPGDEIIVKYYPNSGYKLVAATANDAAIVEGKFTMPKANVVVKPYFQAINEEEIQLKVGSYVCATFAQDGMNATHRGDFYQIITVNSNNTIDVKTWFNDYYTTLIDVNVVREGNLFNVNDVGAKVYILDEDTLICQYQGTYNYTIVFQYVEDLDVDEIQGTYSFSIYDREEYWDITINANSTIKIEMKEDLFAEPFNTIEGNFKLYGDRVEISADESSVYLAVLHLSSDNSLMIGHICQIVPDEIDGVGQDFKQIGDDRWYRSFAL